jgi:hypothetical protein
MNPYLIKCIECSEFQKLCTCVILAISDSFLFITLTEKCNFDLRKKYCTLNIYSGTDEHSCLLLVQQIVLHSSTCLKRRVFKLIQQFEGVQKVHEHRKDKERKVVRKWCTVTHNYRAI